MKHMLDQTFDNLVDHAPDALPLHTVRPDGLAGLLDTIPPAQAAYLKATGFAAKAQELVLLPGAGGLAGAVLGLGSDRSPWAFGGLATRLPEGKTWALEAGDYDAAAATLGYCLGSHRYGAFKAAERAPACLVTPTGQEAALSQAAAIAMVRDLINAPANILGPVELGDIAVGLASRHGAVATIVEGAALDAEYPTVAAVGRGSARPARVVTFRWRGSQATDASPLVSLCGKGVCFDTGGYDLKPSSGMLRMKKDMGGAATVLGLSRMIMEADLPVRLVTRIGCVENSVSGTAMRPLDVIRTRSGLTVEVGNTDAEGRLVLCDLLHDASNESPDLLLDCATLTGAARVAVGPDLPALFCSDDEWAEALLREGIAKHDPMWRLPLWRGYDDWLKSPIADLNNVSSRPHAGAVVAALFLQRFVTGDVPWIHLDLYAWNDQSRPGRPEGGEAQTLRAVFSTVQQLLCEPK
jgi:leucyl aminopeptidase